VILAGRYRLVSHRITLDSVRYAPRITVCSSDEWCVYAEHRWVKYAPPGTRQWQPFDAQRVPVIDKWAGERIGGGLVDNIKNGTILLTGQIVSARDHHLLISHGSSAAADWWSGPEGGWGQSSVQCDVVILATGFKPTHGEWLHEAALGSEGRRALHKVGFSHGDALLPLRQIGKEALAVGRAIASLYGPQKGAMD
jgi:hypothetical protein